MSWEVGMARCKCCGWEWVGVVELPWGWLECPKCNKECGDFIRHDSNEISDD